MSHLASKPLYIFLCLLPCLAAQGQGAGEVSDDVLERAYLETVALLRDQHRNVWWANQRLERIEGIIDYARDAARRDDLTAEEQATYEEEVDYLREESAALKVYLKKDAREYVKQVEDYIENAFEQYKEVKGWERVRRSLWKKGAPRFTLNPTPPGPLQQPVVNGARGAGSPKLKLELVPAPGRGNVATWTTSSGTLEVLDEPEDGTVAILTPGLGTEIRVTVRIEGRKIKMPLEIHYDVPIGDIADRELVDQYREDLAALLNYELGLQLNEREIDSLDRRMRMMRGAGVDDRSDAMESLKGRRLLLSEELKLQKDWIAYLHRYALPSLVENDSTGQLEAWEWQRLAIAEEAPKDRLWPWHITAGDQLTDLTWHYVVPDLPEGSTIRWKLGDDPEYARPIVGDAVAGTFVQPYRNETEVLSAHLTLPWCTLPIRLDWILPPNRPAGEEDD